MLLKLKMQKKHLQVNSVTDNIICVGFFSVQHYQY